MYITVIDLGTSRIKGIITQLKRDGSFYILKTIIKKSSGMKRGEIVRPDEIVRPLALILREIKDFDKRCLKNLSFSVSGVNSRFDIFNASIIVAGPDRTIVDEDINRITKEAVKSADSSGWNIIHTTPQSFIVDGIEIDEQNIRGLSGKRLEANIIVVSMFGSVYKNLSKVTNLILGKSGEFSGSLFFAPLASDRSVLSTRQKDLGVVLLDIGSGTIGMVVYYDGKQVSSKVFPFGSDNITNDIAIGLKCDVGVAEKIKKEFGVASAKGVSSREKIDMSQFDDNDNREISKKYISEIIEARVREMFRVVNKDLVMLELNERLPAGAIFTGGGSKMVGITEIGKEELKLPVHIGLPNIDRFEPINSKTAEILEDPEMSVVVGMALHKMDIYAGDKPIIKNESAKEKNYIKKIIKKVFRIMSAIE